MSDKISKIIQWSLYILMGLSALVGILFYTNTGGNIDLVLYWGYVLVILVLAVTLLGAVLNLMQNPKGSIKLLIALALIVVVFFVSYALSKNTFSPVMLEKKQTTATTVRLVGAGLFILYLTALASIGVILYTTIAKFFK